MAAITIVSANPVARGPWEESQQTGPVMVGAAIWTISRKRWSRVRYEWTAKGAQSSRDLPAAEQHVAAGTEYLKDRGFELGPGGEYAKDPDSNVWGVYWEEWEDYLGQQYWDGDSWEDV